MPTATAQRDDIVLTCSPEKTADAIVLSYRVTNQGRVPAYVAAAMPRVDPEAKSVSADPNLVTIWRGADGHAHVLMGVAAMPTDRFVLGRTYPLMVRLEPSAEHAHELTLVLPLAEQSPYFSLGNLRNYRLADMVGIALAIDVVVARAPEPVASAVAYAPGLFTLRPADMLSRSQRLICSFTTKGLSLLMLGDTYPRPD